MSKRANEGIQALQESEKDVMCHIIDRMKKTFQEGQALASLVQTCQDEIFVRGID